MKIKRKITGLLSIMLLILCSVMETVQAGTADDSQYWPAGPEIVSSAGLVMEADTGTILYEKNIHEAHYPASITKILTTLLVLENSSMDEVVTFSHDSVYNTGGSGIARDVGEEMTMEQCLYGVMLASANECAYAVAEHVGGDIGSFVNMMNERASLLGCQDTHFSNCNGLPADDHYTSAYDMALIAREAYQNEAFRIICGTKKYTIPFTNKHTDEETYLQNHHQMLYPLKTTKYLYDYCLGGKTGYTTVANNTLVTYAEKDGVTLICVVLDAPAGSHYEDTRALFDFCFDNFKKVNVSDYENSDSRKKESEGILGNYEPFVALDVSSSVILPITAEFSDTAQEVVYNEEDQDVLGSIQYTYAGRFVGSADITATNAVVEAYQFQDKNTAATESLMGDITDTEQTTEEKSRLPVDIQIDLRLVLFVLFGILLLGALIFLIWKFIDNFYIIRRKLNLGGRERSPYKTIETNKMYRKGRHRRWFKR